MRTAANLALAVVLTAVGTVVAQADIHQAASEGDIEQVRQLLDEGADPNDIPEEQALRSAARVAIATALLDAGADINARDADGATPLALALESDYAELADLLRARGGEE
ncbi:MAG: ankyrin repeat domain-containing protein [Armatimonadota bacterium]|nr:ankyrin repeat domain-containing protein [Armatimonadota bacterium]